jgi:Fic/DOC family
MDWDADSTRLLTNLESVLSDVRNEAKARSPLSSENARAWQRGIMRGLAAPDPIYIGRFRGEPDLENCEVEIAGSLGVDADRVREALRAFDAKLAQAIALLDDLIAPDDDLTADEVGAVIDLCAWAHAEWVRIHPFANGNGRTARIFANAIAIRYGLPPFVRLRPRPDGSYGSACSAAMAGVWQPTATLFRQLYREAISRD